MAVPAQHSLVNFSSEGRKYHIPRTFSLQPYVGSSNLGLTTKGLWLTCGEGCHRQQFTCPKGHLSKKYRHRVKVRARVRVRATVRVRVRFGLASTFGICTTTFWTNDPSDK